MTTHSSILAWEIPWTEEPGGLLSLGSQRVGYNLVTEQQCFFVLFFFYTNSHFRRESLVLFISSINNRDLLNAIFI